MSESANEWMSERENKGWINGVMNERNSSGFEKLYEYLFSQFWRLLTKAVLQLLSELSETEYVYFSYLPHLVKNNIRLICCTKPLTAMF